MEDQQLVIECLNTRSEQAFSNLYRSKTPHLYQMALRLTQDEDASQELVQEMWIIAIRKLHQFEWRSKLSTWLIGILINLSRTRRKKTEQEVALDNQEMVSDTTPDISFATVHDLEKGIAQLPPGYRQIIILHDVEGYKHREIAELLDIGEGTSKSQLFYARKALREFLSDVEKRKKS